MGEITRHEVKPDTKSPPPAKGEQKESEASASKGLPPICLITVKHRSPKELEGLFTIESSQLGFKYSAALNNHGVQSQFSEGGKYDSAEKDKKLLELCSKMAEIYNKIEALCPPKNPQN